MHTITFTHKIPQSCFDYQLPESITASVTCQVDEHGRVIDATISLPLGYLPLIGDRWTLQQEMQEAAEKLAHQAYMMGSLIAA